jgi:hypothetical protein
MAQTIRYWNAGKTDPSQNASWQDGVGGASAVPTTSNVVYFAQGSDRVIGDSSSLDKALAYASVTRGFSGTIGSNGTPMTIGANTNSGATQYGVDGATSSGVEKFDYAASGGQAYITAGTGGIDVVRVDTNGKLWLTGGTINTRVEFISGQLDISTSVTLSSGTLELWGGNSTINYLGDATPPAVNIYGGTHYCMRKCGNITLYGGTLILDVQATANVTNGTITVAGEKANLDWRRGAVGSTQINFLMGNVIFNNAYQPIDLSGASLIVLGAANIDTFGRLSSKVTWPASTAIQLKGLGAGIARPAAASV